MKYMANVAEPLPQTPSNPFSNPTSNLFKL